MARTFGFLAFISLLLAAAGAENRAGQTAASVMPEIVALNPPEKDFFSKRLDFHGVPIKAPVIVMAGRSLECAIPKSMTTTLLF